MTSLKGKFFADIMGKFGNFNSITNSDTVGKIRKLNKYAIDRCPKGFSVSKEQTPDGTRFERISKDGNQRNGKIILYFHGGGYIAGLLFFYRNFAEDFCDASGGAEMIFLDYKLAPEYKYPVQLDEALDLWHDLTGRQGYNPENIILGGDSAGANLALAMMLKLRDNNEKLPVSAFCISAWADMTGTSDSFFFNYGKDVEFGEAGKTVTKSKRKILLNSPIYSWIGSASRTDPYISPVFADYHGFPPMLFTVGGDEMLLSDTLTIVRRLRELHIPVKLDVQPHMFHIYTVFRHAIPESSHSYSLILKFIKHTFRD